MEAQDHNSHAQTESKHEMTIFPTERILRNSNFTITEQILRGNWKSERDDLCSEIFYEPQKRAYGDGSSWTNPRGPNNRVPQELPTHLQTLTSTSLPFSVPCSLSVIPFLSPSLLTTLSCGTES